MNGLRLYAAEMDNSLNEISISKKMNDACRDQGLHRSSVDQKVVLAAIPVIALVASLLLVF